MKALSIIGIVLSILSFIFSIFASREIGGGLWLILSILFSLYFLAFSIVACVSSFKKKV